MSIVSIPQSSALLFDTDSYKVSMPKQYPTGTEIVSSYITSRGGEYTDVMLAGVEFVVKTLQSTKITREDVMLAKSFWEAHGEPFYAEGWMKVVDEFDGIIPVTIRALDEGKVYPVQTPLMVIENAPGFWWLTTWIETMALRAVWYMTTVATNSFEIKCMINKYLKQSGDVSGLPFSCHDFGSRGVSSQETAMLGGLAHLFNFMGTDTAIALFAANKLFGAPLDQTAFSIPAAEHSTITSWTRGNEALAYENMVKQFSKPGSIYAVVSDSYDIYNAVDNIWGEELRDLVVSSGGTLVIRPDSGDPVVVLPRLLQSLSKKFGYTINDKGYIVLNNVRLIWGDGINYNSIKSIYRIVVDTMRFSADNLAFGMGGALLQIVNRDDQKFAMKASAARINGEWIDVYKDPITDSSKKSMKGRFSVVLREGKYVTIPYDESLWNEDLLKIRYNNGEVFDSPDFATIRARAQSCLN